MVRRWLERGRAAWRWGRQHRYQLADICYALITYPVALLGMLAMVSGTPLIRVAGPLLAVVTQTSALPLAVLLSVWLGLVVPGLAALSVLVRRRWPDWTVVAALVLLMVFGNPFALPIAVYSYAVWSTNRKRLLAWSGGSFAALLVVFAAPDSMVLVPLTAMLVFALLFGLWVGTRRQLVHNLRERADRLEREQHLRAERAIVAERTRIAREMHDVVAHRVSLMVLHAGGLEVSAPDARTAEAAGLIRTTGREALTELREILGVLRDNAPRAAPTAPQPVLADLDRLVGDARAAGMAVTRHTTGTPRPLPAQVERTVYRVVQEALTNAAKHAPGAPVEVRLDRGVRQVAIIVDNTAAPVAARVAAAPSSGYGLAGLRERLALVGGVLTAGPLPGGGWRVHAAAPVAKRHGGPGSHPADPLEETA